MAVRNGFPVIACPVPIWDTFGPCCRSSRGLRAVPLPRPQTVFEPTIQDFVQSREAHTFTVLCGPNNSGKTYLLKMLCQHFNGKQCHFCGCSRFFTLRELGSGVVEPNYIQSLQNHFMNSMGRPDEQNENGDFNHHGLEPILRGLTNSQRSNLFGIFKDLIGNDISLQHVVRDNEMTQMYVEIDGEPMHWGSTGTRLIVTLLGTCFDTRIHYLFIDEPEMGLSPKIQTIIGRLFSDETARQTYMPHLKGLYIATHSHLFLDRKVYGNNFIVTKLHNNDVGIIRTEKVEGVSQFNQLQFNLLGNDVESLFMPSAIVIVEGKSDQLYLGKLISLRIPDRKITVMPAGGEGEVEKKAHTLREAFGDIRETFYHSKMFPILDVRNGLSRRKIAGMGIKEENITVWSKNGTEHLYPKAILRDIFHCDDAMLNAADLEADPIELCGVRKTKVQLAELVCSKLTAETELPAELAGLLSKLIEATK